MAVTDWRIDRSSKVDGLGTKTRLRGPYRVLRAIFSDEGDTTEDGAGSITTGWFMKRKGTSPALVFVHDKQDEANRKFNLENFRARPQYDWYVVAKDEASLKDFCGWLSKEIIRRVEAEPQPKRLTAAAKEKVNTAIAKGMSVQDAMKKHAEWELIAPAAEAFKWPMKDPPKELVKEPPKEILKLVPKDAADKEDKEEDEETDEEPPEAP